MRRSLVLLVIVGGAACAHKAPPTRAPELVDVEPRPADDASMLLDPAPPASEPPRVEAQPAAPPTLSDAEVAAVVQRTEAFYAAAAPFQCDYAVDTPRHQGGLRPGRFQLRLVFVRPGRFRAELSTGEVWIVDGKRSIWTDPKTGRTSEAAVPDDYVPPAQLFAGGRGSLTRRGSLRGHPGTTLNVPGTDILVVDPTATGTPPRLVFFVDAKGEVRRAIVAGWGATQNVTTNACMMHVPVPPASAFTAPAAPSLGPAWKPPSPLLGVP